MIFSYWCSKHSVQLDENGKLQVYLKTPFPYLWIDSSQMMNCNQILFIRFVLTSPRFLRKCLQWWSHRACHQAAGPLYQKLSLSTNPVWSYPDCRRDRLAGHQPSWNSLAWADFHTCSRGCSYTCRCSIRKILAATSYSSIASLQPAICWTLRPWPFETEDLTGYCWYYSISRFLVASRGESGWYFVVD